MFMSIDVREAQESPGWDFKDLVLATPVTRSPWFVVAASSSRSDQQGDPEPTSLVHAKAMGSISTACGLPVGNWPRFYHLAFPPRSGEVCAACVAAGQAARRRQRKSFPGRPVTP